MIQVLLNFGSVWFVEFLKYKDKEYNVKMSYNEINKIEW